MQETILVNRKKIYHITFSDYKCQQKAPRNCGLGPITKPRMRTRRLSFPIPEITQLCPWLCVLLPGWLCVGVSPGNFFSNALLKGNLNAFWEKKKNTFFPPWNFSSRFTSFWIMFLFCALKNGIGGCLSYLQIH